MTCRIQKKTIIVLQTEIVMQSYLLGIPNGLLGAPLTAGGTVPGFAVFVPTISIFIGFPSSSTLLYLLTAARASTLREKTTSAVPYLKYPIRDILRVHPDA